MSSIVALRSEKRLVSLTSVGCFNPKLAQRLANIVHLDIIVVACDRKNIHSCRNPTTQAKHHDFCPVECRTPPWFSQQPAAKQEFEVCRPPVLPMLSTEHSRKNTNVITGPKVQENRLGRWPNDFTTHRNSRTLPRPKVDLHPSPDRSCASSLRLICSFRFGLAGGCEVRPPVNSTAQRLTWVVLFRRRPSL